MTLVIVVGTGIRGESEAVGGRGDQMKATAVITGGSSGLGTALVAGLLDAGEF